MSHPSEPRPFAVEMQIFREVVSSELYCYLSECRDIFDLLFEQQITPKKAIEAIAERRLGYVPHLPASEPRIHGGDNISWQTEEVAPKGDNR